MDPTKQARKGKTSLGLSEQTKRREQRHTITHAQRKIDMYKIRDAFADNIWRPLSRAFTSEFSVTFIDVIH